MWKRMAVTVAGASRVSGLTALPARRSVGLPATRVPHGGGARQHVNVDHPRPICKHMKLASLRDGSRDGQLVVVSRDLTTAHYATGIAPTLQQALDDWDFMAPQLQDLYDALNAGRAAPSLSLRPGAVHGAAAARLPVGRRLGLHQPRRAGAQGAQRRDARELLHRSADVPGRQRRLPRPAATTSSARPRPSASTSRPRSRSSPATCRWAPRPPRPATASAW